MKMNEVVIHTNSDRSSKCNVGLKKKSCGKICIGSYDFKNVLKCPNYYIFLGSYTYIEKYF